MHLAGRRTVSRLPGEGLLLLAGSFRSKDERDESLRALTALDAMASRWTQAGQSWSPLGPRRPIRKFKSVVASCEPILVVTARSLLETRRLIKRRSSDRTQRPGLALACSEIATGMSSKKPVRLARRLRLNAPGRQLPGITLSNEAGERGNRSGTSSRCGRAATPRCRWRRGANRPRSAAWIRRRSGHDRPEGSP